MRCRRPPAARRRALSHERSECGDPFKHFSALPPPLLSGSRARLPRPEDADRPPSTPPPRPALQVAPAKATEQCASTAGSTSARPAASFSPERLALVAASGSRQRGHQTEKLRLVRHPYPQGVGRSHESGARHHGGHHERERPGQKRFQHSGRSGLQIGQSRLDCLHRGEQHSHGLLGRPAFGREQCRHPHP